MTQAPGGIGVPLLRLGRPEKEENGGPGGGGGGGDEDGVVRHGIKNFDLIKLHLGCLLGHSSGC